MQKEYRGSSEGINILFNNIQKADNLPVSFTYNDIIYDGLKEAKAITNVTNVSKGIKTVVKATIDKTLRFTLDCFYNEEYSSIEYSIYFENTGIEPSKVLKDVCPLNINLNGEKPVLRGIMGDNKFYYAPYEQDLEKADKYFVSKNGKPTYEVFPYFDLEYAQGGAIIANGWGGTWDALFSYDAPATHVRIKSNITFESVILPGEKVKFGSIVLIPYRGRDYDIATNIWREWYMKNVLPKADGTGKGIEPFVTVSFNEDTSLELSEKSLGEKYFSWQPSLERVLKEEIKPEFRLIDAGWYSDPAGKSITKDWWGNVGGYKADSEKWPNNSFREAQDIAHSVGVKVGVTFESERITHINDMVDKFGYKYEWAIGDGNSRMNNLGNPDCLEWTFKHITDTMETYGVDLYREDSCGDFINYWLYNDKLETKNLDVARNGITENKFVNGHLELWDKIIDYCSTHDKCTFIDTYCNGGCRNDYESMKRAIPFFRSSNDKASAAMRLSQTTSLSKWLPFTGSYTKETEINPNPLVGRGISQYTARASLLPIWNISEAFNHNSNLDYDLLRKNLNEWKLLKHLFTKDMYVLTPWHAESSREAWISYSYDDPEKGEGVLFIFRPEESKSNTGTIKIPYAKDGGVYSVRDMDSGKALQKSGRDLVYGIKFFLPETKSSAVLYIKKMG